MMIKTPTINTKIILFLLIIVCGFFVQANPVLANKSSVTIEAPDSVKSGTEITITIHVSHKGNNFIHFTDWAYIAVNGKEIGRWEFSRFKRPESGKFIRSVQYKVTGPIEISAEADCNIHGSAGIVKKEVYIK